MIFKVSIDVGDDGDMIIDGKTELANQHCFCSVSTNTPEKLMNLLFSPVMSKIASNLY